jgi:hypothetical protein
MSNARIVLDFDQNELRSLRVYASREIGEAAGRRQPTWPVPISSDRTLGRSAELQYLREAKIAINAPFNLSPNVSCRRKITPFGSNRHRMPRF